MIALVKSIIVITQNRDFFGAKLVHVPLLHALRKSYPNAKLTLLVPYQSHRLFTEFGLADNIDVYGYSFTKVVASFWRHKPDLIINLRPESGALDWALPFAPRAKKISFDIGFAKWLHDKVIPTDLKIYRALNYLRLLEPLNIKAKTEDFFKDQWGFEYLPSKTSPKILLIVGAGTGEWKRWGIENFLTLAEHLIRENPSTKIGIIRGETEKPYEPQILDFEKRFRSHVVELPFNSNPRTIVDALKTANLVVGCDAGPSHLVQLCHVPFLSITSRELPNTPSPEEWNRLDDRTQVILSDPGQNIKEIPVANVLKRALELLKLTT